MQGVLKQRMRLSQLAHPRLCAKKPQRSGNNRSLWQESLRGSTWSLALVRLLPPWLVPRLCLRHSILEKHQLSRSDLSLQVFPPVHWDIQKIKVTKHMLSASVWPFASLWTVAHQAPLFMGVPGKKTRVGCYFLLQGILPTHGSNSCLICLLIDSRVLYHSHHLGNPNALR